MLWRWVNDPAVRQASFQTEPIAWAEHEVWFRGKQNDRNCHQYIAADEQGQHVGQIRFDIHALLAEIDYSIDARFRGQGFGAALLKNGITQLMRDIKRPLILQGSVKKENRKSRHLFEKTGFKRLDQKQETQFDEENKGRCVYRLRVTPAYTEEIAERQAVPI